MSGPRRIVLKLLFAFGALVVVGGQLALVALIIFLVNNSGKCALCDVPLDVSTRVPALTADAGWTAETKEWTWTLNGRVLPWDLVYGNYGIESAWYTEYTRPDGAPRTTENEPLVRIASERYWRERLARKRVRWLERDLLRNGCMPMGTADAVSQPYWVEDVFICQGAGGEPVIQARWRYLEVVVRVWIYEDATTTGSSAATILSELDSHLRQTLIPQD